MPVNFDDSDFKKKSQDLEEKVEKNTKQAVSDVASEIMRLSHREVPHDKGELENSGEIDPKEPALEVTVGYNKVYAARLHEHPEYKFQKGRKGKYLEDPIKNNLAVFLAYFKKVLGV